MKNVVILDEYVTPRAHYKKGQTIAMDDVMADELCTTLPRFFRPENMPPWVVVTAPDMPEVDTETQRGKRGHRNRV